MRFHDKFNRYPILITGCLAMAAVIQYYYLAYQSSPKLPSYGNIFIAEDKNTRHVDIIKINTNSTMALDIEQILHHPNESKIEIILRTPRKCKSPVVRGRISGPSLSIIEWSKRNAAAYTNILVGRYNRALFPRSGKYYVEIIGLLCNELKDEDNFTTTCLENPLSHRITSDDASINVRTLIGKDNIQTSTMGRWVHVSQSPYQNRGLPVEPIFTRFQPEQCRGEENELKPRCKAATDLARFSPYNFEWNNSTHSKLDKNYLLKRNKKMIVCFMGFSHSGIIIRQTIGLFREIDMLKYNDYLEVAWCKARYPADITSNFTRSCFSEWSCTHLVVAVGQWPAGRNGTSFPEYKEDMQSAIMTIEKEIADAHQPVDFFLRSIHYNPIGDAIGACPPADFRLPSVIDGYNMVIKELSDEHGIKYLDTDFIMGAMWDSAKDWCHYDNEAGSNDALYILREVTGMNRL